METKRTQLTKDAGLRQLGLTTKRDRSRVSGKVDLARVGAGRQLLKRNTFMPAVIVGISGSANVDLDGSHLAHLEAPFVIDFYAADEKRLALFDVIASDDSSVLFIDHTHCESVFAQAGALRRLSTQSQKHIAAQTVIDVTTSVAETVPAHT